MDLGYIQAHLDFADIKITFILEHFFELFGIVHHFLNLQGPQTEDVQPIFQLIP